MEQWWKQHEDVVMGDYDCDKVEDVTGCIPLLLNQRVMDGTIDLTAPKWRKICDKSVGFVQRIRSATKALECRWYI